MSKKKLEIRSKYKDIKFSYRKVPSKFESITDGAIQKTKTFSLNSVKEMYPNYPASAIKAMILSVAGDFNNLYAHLEGDYSSRETRLKKAYSDGYAELGQRITNFQLLIQNHNSAFEKYNEINKELLGCELSEDLKYGEEKINDLKKDYKNLKEIL